MAIYIFIIVWVTATYPITKIINNKMEENGDVEQYYTSFQILLFIRSLLYVPKFYWARVLKLLTNKK